MIKARAKIQRGEEVNVPAPCETNDYILMKMGTRSLRKPTHIPFEVELSDEDPMKQVKIRILGGKFNRKHFDLYDNINSRDFIHFIHFVRFYYWVGDEARLDMIR